MAAKEELLILIKAEVDDALKKFDKMNKGFKGMNENTQKLGKNLSLYVTIPLIALGATIIKTASDAEEMNSKFDAVFKEQSGSVRAWADDFSSSVNRSKQDMIKFLSTIQDTLVPLGFARDAAADMSKEVVKLATDLGSFNNLPTADVVRDIQTAIVGNVEVLRKYGVVASQEAIIQEALTSGLIKNKNELNANTKAQAIYNLIVKGTADAQGDALRTAGSFANQLQGLGASATDLAVSFGNQLLPIAKELIGFLSGMIKSFTNLDESTQKMILIIMGLAAAIGPSIKAFGLLQKAMNFLKSHPAIIAIGLLIAGATALNEILAKEATKHVDNARAIKKEVDDTGALAKEFDTLAAKTKLTNMEKRRMSEIERILKKRVGETAFEIDEQTGAITRNGKEFEKYYKRKAQLQLQELTASYRTIEADYKKLETLIELTDAYGDFDKAATRAYELNGLVITSLYTESDARRDLNKREQELINTKMEIGRLTDILFGKTEELTDAIVEQGDVIGEVTENNMKAYEKMGEKIGEILENKAEKEKDNINKTTDAYKTYFGYMGKAFSDMGEMLIQGGDLWKMFGKSALEVLAQMLDAWAEAAIAQAALMAATWNWPGAANALAQAALIEIGAGIIRGIAGSFAQGVDSFKTDKKQLISVGENSGGVEEVTVRPVSSFGSNSSDVIITQPVIIQIDSGPIYRGILKASKSGIVLVSEKAVVK